MRVVHRSEGEGETLANSVELAEGVLAKGRGLMFRRSFPEGRALAMPFSGVKSRSLHSVFVWFPFDAIWVSEGTVTRVARFQPFRSVASARADLVIEVPAGVGDGIQPGDTVELVGSPEG
jgi:uncharacterized membrane protein (UPF0127 family)